MHDAMLWRAQKVTRMFMSPGVLNCLTKQEYSSISLIDTYHLWSNHNEPVETFCCGNMALCIFSWGCIFLNQYSI